VDDHGIYGFAEQPVIEMSNGAKFQYQKPEGATRGMYVPEDSSGVENGQLGPNHTGDGTGSNAATTTNGTELARHATAPSAPSPVA
jgi:hypothetical protein